MQAHKVYEAMIDAPPRTGPQADWLMAAHKFDFGCFEPDDVLTPFAQYAQDLADAGALGLPFADCYFEMAVGGHRSAYCLHQLAPSGPIFSVHEFVEITKGRWVHHPVSHEFRGPRQRVFMNGTEIADSELKRRAFVCSESIWTLLGILAYPKKLVSSVSPPEAVQKARKRRRQIPLFSYHVVDMNRARSEAMADPSGLLRRSPRRHWRMGHPRQIRDQNGFKRVIHVPPCEVGDIRNGYIAKDYRRGGER
jgi:hypothetical protein